MITVWKLLYVLSFHYSFVFSGGGGEREGGKPVYEDCEIAVEKIWDKWLDRSTVVCLSRESICAWGGFFRLHLFIHFRAASGRKSQHWRFGMSPKGQTKCCLWGKRLEHITSFTECTGPRVFIPWLRSKLHLMFCRNRRRKHKFHNSFRQIQKIFTAFE